MLDFDGQLVEIGKLVYQIYIEDEVWFKVVVKEAKKFMGGYLIIFYWKGGQLDVANDCIKEIERNL